MPELEGPPTTDMDKIEITESGITKLLSELNADRAPGPDELPNLLLENAAKEISPFLKDIFEHSIQTGKLPDEWVETNVAPVSKKKGDRHTASNYRPISLTCVCAKLLEHIICKSIMTHFTKKRNFTTCATRFPCRAFMRKSITIDHRRPGSNYEDKIQTDLIVLDFSKAFDVVSHQRLLHKLDHYGIMGSTLLWIQNFLTTRTQKVVVDGSFSDIAHVGSGVPQGTVLGPILKYTLLRSQHQWEPGMGDHISKIASKANSTLGFLRRNLKGYPSKLKEIAYFSMVRSLLEYSCPVWDPYRQGDVDKLNKIQRAVS